MIDLDNILTTKFNGCAEVEVAKSGKVYQRRGVVFGRLLGQAIGL